MIEIFFQSCIIFILNSFFFDCIHYGLHRVGSQWHQAHHLFFDDALNINAKYRQKNLIGHVLFEFLCKFVLSLVFGLWVSWLSILIVIITEMLILVYVLLNQGEDHNHRAISQLKAQKIKPYITANYHALHHLYPTAFFSSHHFLFDSFFGTACAIKGRAFFVTGSDGAFGGAMVKALRKKGGIVYEWLPNAKAWGDADKDELALKLQSIDVLVLSHGSKWQMTTENNVKSQKWLVKVFFKVQEHSTKLPEVWGVGSELEFCSHINCQTIKDYVLSKRAYVRFAQSLYANEHLIYRHIVPSSFSSKMGRGLMSAKWAVRIALFFIRRGALYVPITYTGIAYSSYFHFTWQP